MADLTTGVRAPTPTAKPTKPSATVREREGTAAQPFLGDLAPAFVRSILDSSPDCIKLVELDGSLSFMNENGLCAMQIDRFDLVAGAKWPDLWPDDGRVRVAESVARATEGRTDRFEAFCPTAKGEPRWWDVTVSPVPGSNGRPERILSISRDVTERVEREHRMAARDEELKELALRQASTLEEKEQLLRDKTLLMQEVDHRVKNSLAMITSLLSIQTRRVEGEARDALVAASTRVQTIAAVHERLYRGGETGRLDLGEYIAALCEDLGNGIATDGVEVRTDVAGAGETSGDDAVTIGLLVTELVTNAVRHGLKDGGCAITVRLRSLMGGRRELTVEDDGCGVPEGFDPAKSKGLGMRVVRGNVGRLDGRMDVGRSSKGGARFTIVFPA